MNTNKINNLQIAYIGGGSRGWARGLMSDLAMEAQLSGVVRLYDIDYEAAKANETIGNSLKEHPDVQSEWTYKAEKSLKDALTGADFVVISILPGTFDEMESDVHAPEKYGIYQSVGDTVGPAGVLRAMRCIPMFVEIAEGIKTYCPGAWIINYTNPLSVCVGTLYSVFPGIKAIGCCHEIFHAQLLFAKMLETEYDIKDISKEDIIVNVLGINHFSWIDRASYKNIDLMPLFYKLIDKYKNEGYPLNAGDKDQSNHFRNINKVCFDLSEHYGVMAAAGDRHLAEFMPRSWYLKNPECIEKWGFGLTPVSWRKKSLSEALKITGKYLSGKEQFIPNKSGEEGVKQIKSIAGLTELVTNANMPNIGQNEGLPLGTIVESNAVFSRDSVRPVFSGKLPDAVNQIVLKHAINQQLIIKAGIEKDIDLAFNVFINDNLMTLDIDDAKKLFSEMLNNTRKYLEGWDLSQYI